MPTYDYICDACKHEFEAFESIKADPQTVCPTCHEAKLRRKIGAGAAILFKGSGFYQTDYRSDSYKNAAKADKPPARPQTADSSPPTSKRRVSHLRRTGPRHDARQVPDLRQALRGRLFEACPSFPFCSDRCKLIDLGRDRRHQRDPRQRSRSRPGWRGRDGRLIGWSWRG